MVYRKFNKLQKRLLNLHLYTMPFITGFVLWFSHVNLDKSNLLMKLSVPIWAFICVYYVASVVVFSREILAFQRTCKSCGNADWECDCSYCEEHNYCYWRRNPDGWTRG